MDKLKRIAPYMALGPISGPLAAAAVYYFKRGEVVLGSLYVLAIAEIFVVLPVVVAHLTQRII